MSCHDILEVKGVVDLINELEDSRRMANHHSEIIAGSLHDIRQRMVGIDNILVFMLIVNIGIFGLLVYKFF